MALLRTQTGPDATFAVQGHGALLRPPLISDYAGWAELRALSREHLKPWEPAWSHDELTRGAFRRRLRHYYREQREDLGYAFMLVGEADGRIMGGLTLSNVRRGVAQAASLGYWLGLPFVSRGLMTAAVGAVLPFAFQQLRLHRLEAASMPANAASIRVLERNRFHREGLARQFLKIEGRWQDHILFARVCAEDGTAEEHGR